MANDVPADSLLVAARAAAGLQYDNAEGGVDTLVKQARELLKHHPPIEVWGVLSDYICVELGCDGKRNYFAAEMLAAAAIRLTQTAAAES